MNPVENAIINFYIIGAILAIIMVSLAIFITKTKNKK